MFGSGRSLEETMTCGTRIDHDPESSKSLHWPVAICVFTTAPAAITMNVSLLNHVSVGLNRSSSPLVPAKAGTVRELRRLLPWIPAFRGNERIML